MWQLLNKIDSHKEERKIPEERRGERKPMQGRGFKIGRNRGAGIKRKEKAEQKGEGRGNRLRRREEIEKDKIELMKRSKPCKQYPNASFDPKTLISAGERRIHTEKKQSGLSLTVSAAAVWEVAVEAVRELDNEHTGRICLVVVLSVISKILQPRDWGGKLTRAVKKIFQSGLIAQGKRVS